MPALGVAALAISCGPIYTASLFRVPTNAIINDWSSPDQTADAGSIRVDLHRAHATFEGPNYVAR